MKYSFEFGALSFDHFFYELFWITKLQLQTVQFSVLKQLIVLEHPLFENLQDKTSMNSKIIQTKFFE